MSLILLADDDELIRRVVNDILSEQGHEIAVASTGEKALQLLEAVELLLARASGARLSMATR